MKKLLHECSKNTDCNEKTVEKVINCFIELIATKLSEGGKVNFDTFSVEKSTGNTIEIYLHTTNRDTMTSCPKSSNTTNRIKSDIQRNEKPNFSNGLLETLQFQIGCMYLSDLHDASNLPLVQNALRKINHECFDVREWNDAVNYITGRCVHFATQADAAQYLRDFGY